MQNSQPTSKWWDWPAVGLLFLSLYVVASRLVTTSWTPNLYFVQTFTVMGLALGLSLGYSTFKRSIARWLSFCYMAFMLPLLWAQVIDTQVDLDERLISVMGRLLFSLSEFFARRPVEDPLFFVAVMSALFWVLSASAGFSLARNQHFIASILPAVIGILVIQHYDNQIRVRIWFLALFIFLALSLLGRLKFLQDQAKWRTRRVFLSPENSLDLTTGMTIAAGLIILTAWTLPISFTRIDTLRQAWNQLTKPWTDFTERMENAVSALDSPSGGRPGEFYGTELELGRGFPLSDTVMFRVEVPDLAFDQKPPRYYWRGRTYDYYSNDQWYMTGTAREDFAPADSTPLVADTQPRLPSRFIVTTGETRMSLLYAPSQPVWVSRPGSFLAAPAEDAFNIYSWNATPALLPGETYQVEAVLNNPTIEALRTANTVYPQWVTERYLQLPENFPARIQTLATEVTANATTPYDKALAVTQYLRENIEYASTIPNPPSGADALEWVLFEHKQAYCVYYASAEVLMLRSVGIPARMAVGFAQGTGSGRNGLNEDVEDIVTNLYTVRKNNAHAWPEVYFPGIGWVEFEPTGNQAPLDRPLAPRDNADLGGLGGGNFPLPEPETTETPDRTDGPGLADPAAQTLPPTLYLLPLFIALATLTVFLGRRYNAPARVPALVRATLERTGFQVPVWLLRWERWGALTPVQKQFETINFGLRWVNQPAPLHATPGERATALSHILPQLAHPIKVLLDEHQTSLYTSHTADEKLARRAANQIRTQVLIALIRYFWTGRYYDPQVIQPEP